ncbi:MAG: biotin/lipoyl-binding protein [Anaerolineae bacterium]
MGVKYRVVAGGRAFEIEIDHERLAWVDGQPLYLDLEQVGGLPVYSLSLDEAGYMLFVEEGQEEYRVEVQGRLYPVRVVPDRPHLAPRDDGGMGCEAERSIVQAPLAGHLVALPVVQGQEVAAGQVVAVVESMKMEMELKAPRRGIVAEVHGSPGRDVAQEEPLVTIC